jgi:hypothetical protein
MNPSLQVGTSSFTVPAGVTDVALLIVAGVCGEGCGAIRCMQVTHDLRCCMCDESQICSQLSAVTGCLNKAAHLVTGGLDSPLSFA